MRKTWIERHEERLLSSEGFGLPSNAEVREQAAQATALAEAGILQPKRIKPADIYGTWQQDGEFDIARWSNFQMLLNIRERFDNIVSLAIKTASQTTDIKTPEGLDYAGALADAYAGMYHHVVLWRLYGRRVYSLDETMWEMLARTELPALPATLLSSVVPAFYLKLPPKTFKFGSLEDAQYARFNRLDWADGISVVIDKSEPTWEGSRQISLLTTTDSEPACLATATLAIGPDALISELNWERHGQGAQRDYLTGSDAVGEIVPRVVFGLLLYLASEHPTLIRQPPAQRDVTVIKNPAKRRDAEQENERNTRYGYYEVRIAHMDEVTARHLGAGKKWTLDHQVWVSGHWRQQAYGMGRALRRPVWIKPFVRGLDMAESLKVRLGRVPAATERG